MSIKKILLSRIRRLNKLRFTARLKLRVGTETTILLNVSPLPVKKQYRIKSEVP